MPVFSTKNENAMLEALKVLRERMVLHHIAPPVTVDEIYCALVRPEHVHPLREADRVVGIIQRHAHADTKVSLPSGALGTLRIGFTNKLERLLPAYATNGFHDEADQGLKDAVHAWVKRRWQIGAAFALAKAAFKQINDEMNNLSQLRIYFPGALSLMNQTGDPKMHEKAAKVAEAPVPASLPSIAPELRNALMDATRTIARASLFAKEPPPARELSFSIPADGLGSIDIPWKTNIRTGIE